MQSEVLLSHSTILVCAAGAPARASTPVAPDQSASSCHDHRPTDRCGACGSPGRRPAGLLVEVADDFVSIKKSITPLSTVTTLTAPGDTLTIQFTAGQLVVTGRGGTLRLDGTTPDAAKRLVAALHRSVAVQAARVLLGRLALQTQSVAGRSLVLTRALLGSAAGTLAEVVTDAADDERPASHDGRAQQVRAGRRGRLLGHLSAGSR